MLGVLFVAVSNVQHPAYGSNVLDPIPHGEPSLDEQGFSPDDIQCIEQQITENPQYLEVQPASTLPIARRRRPKRQNRQKRPQKSRPSHLSKTGLLIDLN